MERLLWAIVIVYSLLGCTKGFQAKTSSPSPAGASTAVSAPVSAADPNTNQNPVIVAVSPPPVSAVSAVAAVAAPGTSDVGPLVVKVLATNGTLQAGEVYIYFHDATTQTDHLSHLVRGGFLGLSNNSNASFSGGERVLWGAGYTTLASVPDCFLHNGNCEVKVISHLFDPNIPGLQARFDSYVSSLILNMNGKISLANGSSVAGLGLCPSNGVPLRYPAIRDLAQNLQYGERLFPFLYRTSDRQASQAALVAANASLMSLPTDSLVHSDYQTCYGAAEEQTEQMTIAGMNEWSQAQNLMIDTSYISSAWNSLVNGGIISTLSTSVLTNATPVPDVLGQYFEYASIMQRSGLDVIQASFTASAINQIFSEQTNASPQASGCTAVTSTYGGWYHSRGDDCAQKMGYHAFIVDGLLSMYQYAQPMGGTSYWHDAVAATPYNLAAALAFIVNVQNAQGAFWDQAPGSTSQTPTEYGTPVGIAVGTRILAFLRLNGFSNGSAVKVSFSGSTLTLSDIDLRINAAVNYDLHSASLTPYYLGDFLHERVAAVVPLSF